MSLLSEYLEQINADISEDDENKLYLKIRGFATDDILNTYFREVETTVHTGSFFDKKDFSNLRESPKKLYRNRDGGVQRYSEEVQSHIYGETQRSSVELSQLQLSNYLEYTFERKCCIRNEPSGSYEVFYDKLTSTVHYEVITWKIQIPSKTLKEVKEIVDRLPTLKFCHLPVYTKFMYVLQCSPHYELFDELFESSLEYVEVVMKERLLENGKEVEQSKDGQCYLWSFGQLVHFESLWICLMK
jgi:hypothetical protein